MISDFVPIIHRLDGRTIKIWAVADVHIGAAECDIQGFQDFLKNTVLKDTDSYVLLCGDLISNGIRDSLTNVYEETMPPSCQIEKAVELLTPVKDKILGAVGGNHEARSRKAVDLDPMYTIMCMLGIQDLYRTNFAMMRVILANGNTKSRYALMLIHGKTSNKRKNFEFSVEGVDAIISGHVHEGQISRPAKLVFTSRNNVVIKPLVSIVATSWLSYGGYAAAALYRPAATSSPQFLELEYTGSNDREGQIRVVW